MLDKYQDLIDATIKDYVEIQIQPSKSLTLGCSKFGGRPCLPFGMSKPVYMGQEMSLLAQLNFAQIPELIDFPQKGLLQFYIAEYCTIGEVIYIPDIDNSYAKTPNYIQIVEKDFPIPTPLALIFSKRQMPITTHDYRFYDIYKDIASEEFIHNYELKYREFHEAQKDIDYLYPTDDYN